MTYRPTAHVHVCPKCNREWEHRTATVCYLRRTATCEECLESPQEARLIEDDERRYGDAQ